MNTSNYVCPSCKINCVATEQNAVEKQDLAVVECPLCHNMYIIKLEEIK
jgi:predicted RNA-binding Zn-ribbon protein involved in translation (DUF1610 family)